LRNINLGILRYEILDVEVAYKVLFKYVRVLLGRFYRPKEEFNSVRNNDNKGFLVTPSDILSEVYNIVLERPKVFLGEISPIVYREGPRL
jgi:hypothetical protein